MTRMSELAAQYPRYGYRQVRIFLARDGHHMGNDRAYRLWKRAGLQVPRRKARRRVAASRPRPTPPTGPNHVWAYDFVFDTSATGQQIKCLTVVDEWTREALAIAHDQNVRVVCCGTSNPTAKPTIAVRMPPTQAYSVLACGKTSSHGRFSSP